MDEEDGRPRKSLRPRSPTDSMGTDVHSDIAIDDDVNAEMLSLVDRKILASVIMGVDITEVYSPARVAQVARKFGLTPGSSMDLTEGWDFNLEEHKTLAWKRIREEQPYVVVGSPPCTMFSVLQELNKSINKDKPGWQQKFDLEKEKAIKHVEFVCPLYGYQLQQGRHFLHEHP